MNKLLIRKSTGELVPFSVEKLERSLFRSGASPELIADITEEIANIHPEKLTTKFVYKRAFQLLRHASYQLAARYKLKKAILELGPTGFPFEEYIAHLFSFQGFETETGVILSGKRIRHEVDVWAKNHEVQYIVECKHHRTPGYKSDIKVVLYVHSRFNDIVSQLRKKQALEMHYKCWIVTNTRFTTDAIDYASGEGISLMAWDFPGKGSLRERIDISGLYPITCLCSMTRSEKQHLLNNKIVLCREVAERPSLVDHLPAAKRTKVLKECGELSGEVVLK